MQGFIADTLLRAAQNNDTQTALDCFIDQIDPDKYTHTTDQNGRSAYMWSVINQNETLVRAFGEVSAPVNQPDKDGWTIAMHAVNTGNIKIVKLVIKAGAKMSYQYKGISPISLAQKTKNKELIKLVWRAVCNELGPCVSADYKRGLMNPKRIKVSKNRLPDNTRCRS